MSDGLVVDDLAFGYSGRSVGEAKHLALGAGEVMCLLGPNGGGKSTLLKTLLGLLPPVRGRIALDGAETTSWSARRRALAFGYVPQSGGGQFSFTVGDMVLMGRTAHRGVFAAPGAHDRAVVETALGQLGIEALITRDWLRLSGGERQLVLIARALAQEARILVLDEPTANLDFGNQVRVLAELRRLAGRGLGVIFATHHPEQAFACADKVAILHEGQLTEIGAPDAVITPATMRRVYGVDVDIVAIGEGRIKICLPHAWR